MSDTLIPSASNCFALPSCFDFTPPLSSAMSAPVESHIATSASNGSDFDDTGAEAPVVLESKDEECKDEECKDEA